MNLIEAEKMVRGAGEGRRDPAAVLLDQGGVVL